LDRRQQIAVVIFAANQLVVLLGVQVIDLASIGHGLRYHTCSERQAWTITVDSRAELIRREVSATAEVAATDGVQRLAFRSEATSRSLILTGRVGLEVAGVGEEVRELAGARDRRGTNFSDLDEWSCTTSSRDCRFEGMMRWRLLAACSRAMPSEPLKPCWLRTIEICPRDLLSC
jgi:hypothetical protein